jgi:FtsP/CotA-like multicopper oxidase with cupredoxin domain
MRRPGDGQAALWEPHVAEMQANGLKGLHICLITFLSLLSVATLYPLPSRGQPLPVTPGCEVASTDAASQQLINTHGLKEFANPPELSSPPTSEAARLNLIVDYTDITVLGCPAKLRTYNGMIVGPTVRVKPGDTIHLRLINKLPALAPKELPPHPQQPEPHGHGGPGRPFSFNITNLHTHGLHVAPQGPIDSATGNVPFESDNVLLELQPGQQQDYRIHVHEDHPTGTFWYHAHVHGATAIQVSSGMAGALIIEGGTEDNGDLDTVPGIGQVADNHKIFVLQQLAYDETGQVEHFSPTLKPSRPTLINGQLVPVIRMRPGEVQRWRFIHAGVQENLALALDGHAIHEVVTDGITLGRSVPWAEAPASGARAENTLFLFPGYRSDVLVQARQPEPGRKYFLRKLQLNPTISIQAQERAFARAAAARPEVLGVPPVDADDFAPGQILAQLIIEGAEVTDQRLPTAGELAGLIPKDLPDITQAEIDNAKAPETVELKREFGRCNASDGLCEPCMPSEGPDCRFAFKVGNRQFSMDSKATRILRLRTGGKATAAEWTVTTNVGFHPFHIHVNPFQVERMEPDATGAIVRRTVWKDTIVAFGDLLPPLRMRYTRFTGKFVLHCHILQHEDQGMMQLVEIID